MENRSVRIYQLLSQLGVTPNYVGFFHLASAVQLCADHPERPQLVTKWIYPLVAQQYGTTWNAVERNIRTVGNVIWKQNRPMLEQLAHRPLPKRPRSAQLLSILASTLFSEPWCSQ